MAVAGDEIWVAAGAYYPSAKVGGTSDRHKTFQMINGVAIYGGFNGTETSRSQRDVQGNETILSGDTDCLSLPPACVGCDINEDTSVNLEDFAYFAQHWLAGVP
ncbi:MAG: hypothetical protein JXD22_14460 [Sedimentisphaerales bacterium]|nr:hypothetical protein [Sedimentisphaerales bacterium]